MNVFPDFHLQNHKLVATFITLALVSVNLGLSPLEGFIHADAIVPVLSSLIHWSPFYWGQSRFGMAVPLMTSLIDHPLWNLFFQTIICSFLGLLALFCTARFLFGSRYAFATGALSTLGYLALLNQTSLYEYLGPSQPYAPALGLAFAGLCFFEAGGTPSWACCLCRLAGVALIAVGFWVTPSLIVTLGPLVVLRDVLGLREKEPRRRYLGIAIRTWSILGILICCFALSSSLTLLAPVHAHMSFTPVTEWLPAMHRLGNNFIKKLAPGILPIVYAGFSLFGVVLLCLKKDSKGLRIIGAASLCIVPVVLCEFFFVSITMHAAQNGYAGRYLLASRNLLFIMCSFSVLVAFSNSLPIMYERFNRIAPIGLGIVLVLATVLRFGLPSAPAAREAVLRTIPDLEPQITRAGCTHLAGDYWKVWPLVWRILLERHERGEPDVVWGLAGRSENTAPLWSNIPWHEMRICGLKDDKGLAVNLIGHIGVLKPRVSIQDELLLIEPTMPLLYGHDILHPRKADLFPQLPGQETLIRGFKKGNSLLVLYMFPNEEIYRYDIVDTSGGPSIKMIDVNNENVFKPFTGKESIDAVAYGFRNQ